MKTLYLASRSPRRVALLGQSGIPFIVVEPQHLEEAQDGEPPRSLVLRLAQSKAQEVACRIEQGVVIGADTVVVLGRKVLGKPRDADEALGMLHALSGKTHRVFTGLVLVEAGSERRCIGTALTRVTMRDFSRPEAEAYVATGEPLDKAGAYAIQGKGALLVERIDGCYFNVVGLPLNLLYTMLTSFGAIDESELGECWRRGGD
jgi:nucleoside triphosphate pyrophosphatase